MSQSSKTKDSSFTSHVCTSYFVLPLSVFASLKSCTPALLKIQLPETPQLPNLKTQGVVIGEKDFLTVSKEGKEVAESIRPALDAIGTLRIKPFRNRDEEISCTATHVGQGLVVTSGHCLLGSRACNGARLTFGDRHASWKIWQRKIWKSQCLEVISNQSDEARLGSTGHDYAVLRVSNPPPAKVDIDTTYVPSLKDELIALSYPKPQYGQPHNLVSSGPCKVTRFPSLDFFGRMKSLATFSHDCDTMGGSDGAPVFLARTGKMVGIHQSGFRAPNEGKNSPDASMNYAKLLSYGQLSTLLTEMNPYPPTPENELRSFWVGGFSPEIYPVGIPGDLYLHVGTIGAGEYGKRAKFRVSTGLDTSLLIVDGDGEKHYFTGISYSSNMETPRSYLAPLNLYAITTKDSHTVKVAVEDIELN